MNRAYSRFPDTHHTLQRVTSFLTPLLPLLRLLQLLLLLRSSIHRFGMNLSLISHGTSAG